MSKKTSYVSPSRSRGDGAIRSPGRTLAQRAYRRPRTRVTSISGHAATLSWDNSAPPRPHLSPLHTPRPHRTPNPPHIVAYPRSVPRHREQVHPCRPDRTLALACLGGIQPDDPAHDNACVYTPPSGLCQATVVQKQPYGQPHPPLREHHYHPCCLRDP